MKKIWVVLPLTLALAACGNMLKPKQVQSESDYVCENGTQIRVAQGEHAVKLIVTNIPGNPSAVLQNAPGGAKERYANNAGFFGQPTEWVLQEGVASLSYSNEGTPIRTRCQPR